MPRDLVFSFPHMGSYAIVFEQLLRRLFPGAAILAPPPITKRTVALGARHSPDFVCAPFKYNLGNYIEALDLGANVLLQTGMGCRYGYYGELQEQILRDLGYEFRFFCISRERTRPRAVLHMLRGLGCTLPIPRVIEAFAAAVHSIHAMDGIGHWIREHVGFETQPGACEAAWRELLESLRTAGSSAEVHAAKARCEAALAKVALDMPANPLRIGIVGELYTLMEPFSNFDLEKQLARQGAVVSREMSIWFLLFTRSDRSSLKHGGGYLRHAVGANGVDSVAQSLDYARRGYDGIVHMKSFGCIPEINATPALWNLSREQEIPILQLSFDSHTSETGVQTRLEAFTDMLLMRKEG